MAIHERSARSDASPEHVWKLWSAPDTWPDWNPDVRAIALDGPFVSGATGTMTTGQGTHAIRIENVVDGRSFDLVTSPAPASTFRFHCEVVPDAAGSRLSQDVSMSGPLGWLFSLLMGGRIARSFDPILSGLAQATERGE
jgi:hypothetical protein